MVLCYKYYTLHALADHEAVLIFEIIMKLLYPRGHANSSEIFMKRYIGLQYTCISMPTIYSVYNVILSYCFQTCDVNLNQEVEKISHNSPYIVIAGKPGNENAQYFVCGEKMVLIESKSFLDCVIDLFCCFFVFDMVYPESLTGIFLFIQKSLFRVIDDQVSPSCLAKLTKNLSAV